jgi:hypothetical protein
MYMCQVFQGLLGAKNDAVLVLCLAVLACCSAVALGFEQLPDFVDFLNRVSELPAECLVLDPPTP